MVLICLLVFHELSNLSISRFSFAIYLKIIFLRISLFSQDNYIQLWPS